MTGPAWSGQVGGREKKGSMGALVKGPFPQIKTFPTPVATPGKHAYQPREQVPHAMPGGPLPCH